MQSTIRRGRGIEDHFLDIEAAHPGFGGFYMDASGNVNFFVTDTANSAATEAAVREWLERNTDVFLRGRAVRLVRRSGQYSFSQLAEWQGRIRSGATVADRIALIDADESLNRIRLYVRSSDALARVPLLAARLGIPREAIAAEVHAFDVRFTADSTRGVVFPTSGGLEISHRDSVVINGKRVYADVACTIGYNVTVGGLDYFLTASHCNKHEFAGTTGDSIYQPDSSAGPTPIGTTAINPAWSTSCIPGYAHCRQTDAMLVRYGAGISHNKTVILTSVVGYGSGGSKIIGSYLNLSGPQSSERMQGDSIYKTGMWSGTTGGTVAGSCVTVGDGTGTFEVDCTNEATNYNIAGDSGGPMFYWMIPLQSNYRVPEGITWGKGTSPGGDFTLYCTWAQIESDLGVTMLPY